MENTNPDRTQNTLDDILAEIIQKPDIKVAILFVGIQGSGKTSFYKERLRPLGFTYISLDELHNRKLESTLFQEAIASGANLLVDNTNPTRAERARYIEPLRQAGYDRIICCFFQSRIRDCIARNHQRGTTVPDKAIAATSNRLELPSVDEGFTDIFFIKIGQSSFNISQYIPMNHEI